jgi:hypothetical protein
VAGNEGYVARIKRHQSKREAPREAALRERLAHDPADLLSFDALTMLLIELDPELAEYASDELEALKAEEGATQDAPTAP